MTLNQFLPPSPLIAKSFVGIYKNRIDLCVKEEEEVIFHIIYSMNYYLMTLNQFLSAGHLIVINFGYFKPH